MPIPCTSEPPSRVYDGIQWDVHASPMQLPQSKYRVPQDLQVCRESRRGKRRMETDQEKGRAMNWEERIEAFRKGPAVSTPIDGIACGVPGCLENREYPCEGCGRVAGRLRYIELKTEPRMFAAVGSGMKGFEVRRNDRGFLVGDWLRLFEFTKENGMSGRSFLVRVTYVLPGEEFGIDPEYVVLGIVLPEGHKWEGVQG